jgi:sugar phosphate permease
MMAQNKPKKSLLLTLLHPWVICVVGMLFYCYNYFLRVSPSTMQADLSQTFHITATQFGALATFYYLAYDLMQIPAGILYDKFGARFVLFIACLTAVFGLSIFLSADTLGVAKGGRFLIGLGTAFSYIGVLKLASMWLPPNRFATVAGLTTALGMSCGAISQRYLIHVVEAIGYKQALHGALFIGIALSLTIFFIVRSAPKQKTSENSKMQSPMNMSQLGSALKIILTNPQMWLIGIIGALLYLPALMFLDVWGPSYLKTVYQLSTEQAASMLSTVFLGWIIGGPVIGMLSDRLKRRRSPLVISSAIAATLLCLIFYMPGVTFTELQVMFLITGFCLGSHPLCFALGKENNPARIAGTAVAVTNMLVMMGGNLQLIVGMLMDYHTTSPIGANGLPMYTSSDYTFALSVIPLGVAFGILLSMFLKETYCESQAKEEHELVFAPGVAMESA